MMEGPDGGFKFFISTPELSGRMANTQVTFSAVSKSVQFVVFWPSLRQANISSQTSRKR